ncbi:ABC transporter permease [Sporosalibacterium faouarense]|uniref:ABC transporter permease n=1 Tax=Sporosalibacterium faouarense TaxID=516123 RepID=UPI00141C1ED7|nr:ABC transporter permease subunit [Sporosalibacterium faouarense]MTI49658.1 hypothetical protein [Bacillota bacterium]
MINPVLKKELKTRMRTWKTPAILSLYMGLLAGLFLIISYETFFSSTYYSGFRPGALRETYFVLIIFQMILILLIVPATTASSISGERERQTLDLLVGTRLSSFSIIIGKLMASLAQIILFLVVSIPILSILFLFGGFSFGDMILLFVFYIITAFFFGSIGVFISAYFKKTTTTTIISYIITLTLTLGTLIGTIMWRAYYLARIFGVSTSVSQSSRFYPIIMYLNPFSGLSSILENQMGINIFEGLIFRGANTPTLLTFYINSAVSIILSFILLYLASLKINPMKKFGNRNKKSKKIKKS